MTEKLSDEEKLKQLAAKMREAEYKGLSDTEIRERERQKAERKQRNIGILDDTLSILKAGGYQKDGQEVRLRFSLEKMRQVQVFLPSDIDNLRDSAKANEGQAHSSGCIFGCENIDTLALAEKRYRDLKTQGIDNPKILVLNMVSPTHPGGRVRDGAAAQEEELCRRTSLLLSLEGEEAKKYYEYNNALKTRMASNAVMMSANVEVIKDSASEPLNEPFEIAVMSCAAPMVRLGLEGMSEDEYRDMLYRRICGMLLVAASQGYRHLILGAFGCGVFGNDAAAVSDLFCRAFRELSNRGHMFASVDFAVLCCADNDRNYREFCRNFLSNRK